MDTPSAPGLRHVHLAREIFIKNAITSIVAGTDAGTVAGTVAGAKALANADR